MTTLELLHGDTRAGVLEDDGTGRASFEYDPAWVRSDEAFPVSLHLPLNGGPFPGSIAHPFFAGLLPEGALRRLVCRRLGLSEDNDLALLAAIGGECAGALSVRPPGATATPPGREELSPARIEALSGERSRLAALWGEGGARLSLAGAQDKLPVLVEGDRLFLPLGSAASTHLLKFGNAEFRHLPANEAFTTRLAAAGGLRTVQVDVLRFGRATAALVARYDRVREGTGAVRRLHQEDLCQALGLQPSHKYQREGGPSHGACIRLLSEKAQDPLSDTEALLRWQAFNALVGNADGHGKNLSVLHGRRGTVRLAPFYDLVATAIDPRLDRHLAMAVGGEDDPGRLRGAHWRSLAKETGVGEAFLLDLVARLIDDVCRALPQVTATFEAEAGPSPAVERISAVLRRNGRRLLAQLGR